MKFDSTLYMQHYYWFYWVYLCDFLWASRHLFMTDGDPDVFLTASHLRDVLRCVLFVKTTPVYIPVCVWNTPQQMWHCCHWNYIISVPSHLIKYKHGSTVNPTTDNSTYAVCRCEYRYTCKGFKKRLNLLSKKAKHATCQVAGISVSRIIISHLHDHASNNS